MSVYDPKDDSTVGDFMDRNYADWSENRKQVADTLSDGIVAGSFADIVNEVTKIFEQHGKKKTIAFGQWLNKNQPIAFDGHWYPPGRPPHSKKTTAELYEEFEKTYKP